MKLPTKLPQKLILLTYSFLIFIAAIVLDQSIRWTNHFDGALNGLIQTVATGPSWLLFILPLSGLLYGLTTWLGKPQYQSRALLAPALGFLAFILLNLVFDPPTVANRLYRFTGAQLPVTANAIRSHFSGGLLADYDDIYYFTADSADTNTLIAQLQLAPAKFDRDMLSSPAFPGWPDPQLWLNRVVYRGGDDKWNYYLATDAAHEKVYLSVSCI